MEYVRLGMTGLKVSRLCLGTMAFGSTQEWMLKEQDRLPVFKKAYESGINFFDTANVYALGETEQILGKLLKDVGANRHESLHADGPGAKPGRAVSQTHLCVDRCKPQSAGHGLCRPVPNSSVRL